MKEEIKALQDRIATLRVQLSGYQQEVAVHERKMLSKDALRKYQTMAANKERAEDLQRKVLSLLASDERQALYEELTKLGDPALAIKRIAEHDEASRNKERAATRYYEVKENLGSALRELNALEAI